MGDEEIINLYWERNEQALEETERKYGRTLFTISRNIVKIKEDAEECVNDTYHRTWENIPPVRPVYFLAYLAKIARNISLKRLEYQNADKRSAVLVELNEELDSCIEHPSDEDVRMDSAEIGKRMNGFLEMQKPEYRKIFVRRYFYAESVEEIAKKFGVSQGKVKSVLFRMRKSLKVYLEQGGIWL